MNDIMTACYIIAIICLLAYIWLKFFMSLERENDISLLWYDAYDNVTNRMNGIDWLKTTQEEYDNMIQEELNLLKEAYDNANSKLSLFDKLFINSKDFDEIVKQEMITLQNKKEI